MRNACSTGTLTVTLPLISGTVLDSLLLFGIGIVCHLLKGGERLVPDAVQVRPQRGHSVRVELVHPPRPLGPADHQAAVLEHAQVLGYRRTADRQLPRQLADRARTPREQLEDRPPGRIAEQAQSAISVSIH